eukprot:gene8230-1496_t
MHSVGASAARGRSASSRCVASNAIRRRNLGRSTLQVPSICYGTMLFGERIPSFEDASAQLDMCMDHGVNFFDSAEMYPVPQRSETSGLSEKMLGKWMKARGNRHDVIISTKVAGPSAQMSWIRGGPLKLDAKNISAAIDGSLQRLGVDYIDLCQLHWPDRYTFGGGRADTAGSSLPRVASIQNAYSLTCRTFDSSGMAEICHREGVGMLAYSPLAMGLLTGKYLSADGGPAEARLNLYRGRYGEAESRYGQRPPVVEATAAYCSIARQAGMEPVELALRFVMQHPLVASSVVGATTMVQLKEVLRIAQDGQEHLQEDVIEEIEKVHARLPNPTP